MNAVRVLTVMFGLAMAFLDEPTSAPKAPSAGARDDPAAKAAPAKDDKAKEGTAKKHRGKFTISKETTYITGPRDKDGYIDYAAALNERLSKGVTPENNANVLIWKAIGPRPERREISPEFFRQLGMKAPPDAGEYYVDLFWYLKDQFQMEVGDETWKIDEQLQHAMEHAWTAKEFPKVAGWLKFIENLLDLMVEASRRPQFFSPVVPHKTEKGSSGLLGALIQPSLHKCRNMAGALVARAMLKTSQGALADAWQDLLACHRLARLVGSGPSIVDGLVGIAIDGVASRAELALLNGSKAGALPIESCLRDLQKLPPMPALADKLDLGERFVFLDSLMTIDRAGMEALKTLASFKLDDPNQLPKAMLEAVDWDLALGDGNRLYNRMAAALREKDRTRRNKKVEEIEENTDAYLKAQKSKLATPEGQAQILLGGGKARGKVISDILIALLVPAVHKVQNAWDRVQQQENNVIVAFALAQYQRDHGHYPQKLDELVPKYLKEIPFDMFSGKALIYRPNDKGYLLYSVGYNGKDDGGQGYDDDPPGDDLSVRMPRPELPKK